MDHPNEEQREKQRIFLNGLSQQDRPYHARLFRIGNTTFRYHTAIEPTESDYLNWLEGLREPIKSAMKEKGYQACMSTLSLKRHAMELADHGLDEYLKQHLSEDDYTWWRSQNSQYERPAS